MKTALFVMTLAAFFCVTLSSTAWAAVDCKPGMWYLDEDGNTYAQNNAANTRIPCPENCSSAEEFPGYDPNNIGSFSRSQDVTGLCTTYSSIDYICYQLKRAKQIPGTPENSKGCSALDLEVKSFSDQNHDTENNTVDQLLGHRNKERTTLSGNWNTSPNPVQHSLSDYIRVAQKYGICPESLWPSQLDAPGQGGARRMLEVFQSRIRDAKEYAQAHPTSRVDFYDLCPECKSIAPSLTRSQWGEVFKVVMSVDLNQDDFKVLKKANDLACPAEKRIKVPMGMSAWGRNWDDLMRHLSQHLAIAVVSYPARKLDPTIGNGPDGHQIIVYGTVATKDLKGKPVCYYVIKNSWGPKYCQAKERETEKIGVRCLDDGSYLVPGEDLKRNFTQIEW